MLWWVAMSELSLRGQASSGREQTRRAERR